jgi:hypothetical protein
MTTMKRVVTTTANLSGGGNDDEEAPYSAAPPHRSRRRHIAAGGGEGAPPTRDGGAGGSGVGRGATRAGRHADACRRVAFRGLTSGVVVVAVAPTSPEAGAVNDPANAHPHNNHPKRKQFEDR